MMPNLLTALPHVTAAKEIIGRLNAEIVRVLNMPAVKNQPSRDGAEPIGSSPADFSGFIKSEVAKWAKAARSAGIKPE